MNTDCENEGYVKTCPSGQVKDGNNVCPYNNAYFKCRDADNSCDAGSSTTECSDTQVAVSSYQNEAGNTCYQCRDKTCSEGGYTDSLTSCQKGSTVSFANKTCYQNVTEKTCEDMGYQSSIPTNNKCDSTTYCSKTCYTNCKQPTCEDGNYKSGVPTNQVCTPVSYYGRTCYKDCYQPQCSAGGYLDACPTDQSGTPLLTTEGTVSKIALTMKLKSPANVVLFFTKIKKCYSSTTKTPIGVVIDNLNKRAIALDEARVTRTVQDLVNAGYSTTYGNNIGVPGWDWAKTNDLNLMKENVDALNTVLSTISGAKVLNKDNDGYVGGEPSIVGRNDTERVNRCLRDNTVDSSGYLTLNCLLSVNLTYDLSRFNHWVRLVLFYGDCGSYQTSTNDQKCTSVIYNGNTCYKDCRAYTCSDGGYQSSNKFQCATGTLTSVSYKGLTCYHCVGTSTPKPIEECEDLGYLTPGSTAACACTYGTKGETATTSSGSTLSCVRCGTYAECGGSTTQCIKCATSRG